MKIISSGKGIHTPEFHKKKKREKQIKIVYTILFVIVFIAIPIYLLRTNKFLITNVEVKGNSVTQIEEIQKIVMEKISGNYLWFFPRSNDVLYPKSAIHNNLLTEIPRLSAVGISLLNAHTLSISVSEREPFALYCTEVSNLNNPSGCFFLDKTGYIFSEAPAISGGVYFIYTTEPVFETPLRQQFLNPEMFKNLEPFIKDLGQIGLYPKVFINKGDEFNLVFSNGAMIMWKATADLDSVQSDLESFLTDANFTKEKNALQRIIYIDLRFGNKVFYKFHD